jgi:pyruvate formate lyase activating enzyme
MDDEMHKLYTGVGNNSILGNIKRLRELEVPMVVRVPLIEGVNSDRENIRKTAEFVKASISYPKLELLPYHLFGDSKYEALGMEKPPREFAAPAPEYIEELAGIVKNAGVEVVSYK